MESKLGLNLELVNQARQSAAHVADDTQRFIDQHTTVTVERAVCRLLGIDGVIAIPHLGASTPESEDNCARMAADELMAYLSDGNIINSVNFPALSSPRAAGCSRVCVFHKNIPSMLSQVTKLLSDKGVNIENMQSKSRKDVAYTVLDCAGQVGQDALESLVDSEGIIRIRVISA